MIAIMFMTYVDSGKSTDDDVHLPELVINADN